MHRSSCSHKANNECNGTYNKQDISRTNLEIKNSNGLVIRATQNVLSRWVKKYTSYPILMGHKNTQTSALYIKNNIAIRSVDYYNIRRQYNYLQGIPDSHTAISSPTCYKILQQQNYYNCIMFGNNNNSLPKPPRRPPCWYLVSRHPWCHG